MAQGQIKFGVGFNVDKSGLNTLKASLKEIQKLTTADIKIGGNAEKTLKEIQGMASQVEGALERAFNPNLGTINLTKFNNELKGMGLNVGQMGAKFAEAGAKGDAAFRNLTTQLLTTKVQVKQTHELLDKMANTLANTVRWTIASSAVNALTGSIQKAYNYTVDLDTSLNDIRIVTEKSADEMDRFAVKANNAAKVLGASTKAYSDASLIYFQQGLNDAEVEKRTQVTLKAANVTGQSAAAVSEQLTAVWNGYKITAENTESAIDKLAAVAASTAADLEELSTGMSRVASAANIMGVDIDQLNAQLATIVSVTREAPESIGTALKTIYARMSDLEAGTDAETTLGEYTKQMAQFGFQALDAQGNLRDMGDVIEEIGDRWGSLSRNQQVALAQTVAGTRQYARLMSLFDNWEMYEESLQTSINSAGTLQKQQDIYMESTEAHLQKLSTQAEELYAHLFDAESVNDVADALTKLVELVDGFVQSVGGGAGVLQMLGTIGLNVFGTQISKGIATSVRNMQNMLVTSKQLSAQEELVKQLGETSFDKEVLALKEKQLKAAKILKDEEFQALNEQIAKLDELKRKTQELEEQRAQAAEKAKKQANAFKFKTDNVDAKTATDGNSLDGSLARIREMRENSAAYNARKNLNTFMSPIKGYEWQKAELKKQQGLTSGQAGEMLDTTSLEHAAQSAAKAAEKVDELRQGIQSISLDDLINDTKKLLDELDASSNEAKELQTLLNQAMALKPMDGTRDRVRAKPELEEKRIAIIAKLGTTYNKTTEKIIEQGEAAQKTEIEEEKLRKQHEETAKAAEKLGKATNETLDSLKLEERIESIVSLTGKITNLATAWTMLSNIGDIWDNDDLTTGEKFAQTLTNIGMALPMVISGLTIFSPLLEKVKKTQAEVTAANIAEATSEAASAAAQEASNKATQKGIELGAQEAAQDTKTAAGNAAEAATEKTSSQTKQSGGIVVKGAVKGLSKLGWIGAIIAVVLAAAATAALTIKVLRDTSNQALKDAKKGLEEVKTAQANLNAEMSEFKELSQTYQDNIKALDELTKGTKEWDQALTEVNATALELLRTYPELAQYVTSSGADGRITISQEGLDFIKDKKQQELSMMNRSVSYQEQKVREAEIVAATTNLLDNLDIWLTSNYYTEKGGSVFKGQVRNKEIEQILTALDLDDLTNVSNIEAVMKDLGIENKELAIRLFQNRESVEDLILQIKENNSLLEIENREKYRGYLSDMGYGGDDIGAMAAILADWAASGDNSAETNVIASINDKQARAAYLTEYAKLMNLDVSRWKQTGGNTILYEDGEGETHSVEWRDIAERIGQEDFEKSLLSSSNLANISSWINSFVALGNNASRDALMNIVASGTQALAAEDLETFSYNTIEGLKRALSAFSTGDAEYTAISGTIQNLEDTWKNSGLSEKTKDLFWNTFSEKNLNLNELSNKSLNKLKALWNTFYAQGEENATSAIAGLYQALGKHADDFLEEIDFTSKTLEEDIWSFFKENNLEFSINNDAIATFISQVRLMGETAEEAKERVKAINDVLSKLNQHGDTISDDDYELLKKQYGNDIAQYFLDMGDGTRMLTSTAAEFQEAVKKARLEVLTGHIKNAGELINTYSANQAKANVEINKAVNSTTEYSETIKDTNAEELEKQKILRKQYTRKNLETIWEEIDPAYSNTVLTLNGVQYSGNNILEKIGTGQWSHDTEVAINQALFDQYIRTDYARFMGHNTLTRGDMSWWGGTEVSKDGNNLTTEEMINGILKQQEINDINITTSTTKHLYNRDLINNTLSSMSALGYDATQILEWQNKIESFAELNSVSAEVNNTVEAIELARKQMLESFEKSENPEDVAKFNAYITEALSQFTSKTAAETWLTDPETGLGLTGTALDKARVLINNYENEGGFDANLINTQLKIYESQAEAISKINSEYEHMNSLLDQQRNLIKLTMSEDAYAAMEKSYAKSIAAIEGIMSNNKSSMDYWAQEMEKALAGGDTELYEEAKAQWEEYSSAYYESMSQKIELLKEQEINAINAVFKARESANGKSLDYMTENWELSKTKSDMWLDPVNAAYGIDQVRSKFNKALNNTSDINAQRQIRNLMEEQLEALESQDKLSEYDLKRAEAKLTLLEKEIALRDAQNNKTKMQLMRGADGSYSYQYVADANAMVEAEEELAAAQNELYNIDLDEYKSNLDKILDAYQEFQDKYTAAAEAGNRELMELLTTEYLGPEGILTTLMGEDENANILTNLSESLSMLGTSLSALGMGGEDIQAWLQGFDAQGLIDALEDVPSFTEGMEISTDALNDSLTNTLSTVEKIADTMKNATWGENATNGIFGSWDPEKVGSSIVDKLKQIKLEWTPGTENTPGSFSWVGMDTGGYTGEWGSSGRLAMLHEKELVLNKEDTANILNAVDMVRSMKAQLEDSMLHKILSFEQRLGSSMAAYEFAKDLKIEQNVHISAEFPNVSEKSEIEEAFEELINLATQHAFDTRK